MKIMITGSSGYVGYVLSKFFSEQGIKVVGLDVARNPAWTGNKEFRFYECDVTDMKRTEYIFSKEKPTHVIHLAFLMNPIHDTQREYDIDVNGSLNTMLAADKTSSVKQFIQFSSASAYGAWPDNKLWIREEQKLRPRDYRYGINKKRIEDLFRWMYRRDMKLVVLRMCTAIGPLYHKKGGVVSILAKAPFLLKMKNRYCALQFIHENDLTALVELVVNDAGIEGTYNFAPDSYATTKQLVKGKRFVKIPLWLARGLTWVLWGLRIAEMRPAAITLSTYGIIVDPGKLMKRYDYKFRYSTLSGFWDTVKKRKKAGTL